MTAFRVPAGVAAVEDDDGITWVLSTALGRIVRLDEVSTLIWRAAPGADGAGAVVNRLIEAYDWAPDEIREHVVRFVDELTECGLLEREDT